MERLLTSKTNALSRDRYYIWSCKTLRSNETSKDVERSSEAQIKKSLA